jgi:hypothetical protein
VHFTYKDHLSALSNKMHFSKQTKLHFKYPDKKRMSSSLERSPLMDTGRTAFQMIWTIQDPDFPFVSGVLLRSTTHRKRRAMTGWHCPWPPRRSVLPAGRSQCRQHHIRGDASRYGWLPL